MLASGVGLAAGLRFVADPLGFGTRGLRCLRTSVDPVSGRWTVRNLLSSSPRSLALTRLLCRSYSRKDGEEEFGVLLPS